MNLFLLSFVIFLSMNAIGSEFALSCGNSFGRPVTLNIKTVQGQFYEYSAIFTASGTDETTGVLIRSKEYNFEGGTDTEDGVSSFLLSEIDNPTHQLLFNKIKRKNQAVKVLRLDLIKKKKRVYRCKVTSILK